MELIDGKALAAEMREDLKKKIQEAYEKYGKKFVLAVILVGDNPASQIYVRNKQKSCEEMGIVSKTIKLPESATQEEVEKAINDLVADKAVDGILVQLPLPKHLKKETILKLIPEEKDVDGFSKENMGLSLRGEGDPVLSCTPHGIIKLLEKYNVEFEGKHAVVVGRSNIVGKPLSILLLQKDCTVTICHSKTKNLAEFTKTADILVTAAGVKGLVTGDMVKEGVICVDAGMNRVDGKLYGDMDFETVSQKASLITPVPGGVGPMTITMLLYNTYIVGMRNL